MSGLPLSSALYFALTHLYIELHPYEHKGRSTPLKAVLTLCGSVELLEMTRETVLLPQTTHVKKDEFSLLQSDNNVSPINSAVGSIRNSSCNICFIIIIIIIIVVIFIFIIIIIMHDCYYYYSSILLLLLYSGNRRIVPTLRSAELHNVRCTVYVYIYLNTKLK